MAETVPGRLDLSYVALLDALPDATAVLDQDGVIVAVNHAWTMFALDNGGSPERTGVGMNYVEVCERAAAVGCADAGQVIDALRSVFAGRTVEADYEYPCPSPAVGRWYVLRVTPLGGPGRGALVSHVNISVRKQAEQDLQRQAGTDPLTGLANRVRFTERLRAALARRAERSTEPDTGVVYLDLDRFKPVNDTYGHAAGDEVLQTVATRLRSLGRPQDTVARIGGDEFTLVVPRITPAGLAGLVDRIGDALAEPHLVHGDVVRVPASVGSHLARADEPVDTVVRRADDAMYAAKRVRTGRHAHGLRSL